MRQVVDESATMSNVDEPITSVDEDVLDRGPLAATIARYIISVPGGSGAVFGVSGPWGSGKTSILNLIDLHLKEQADDIVVIRFNPWLFSGTRELIESFFAEISAQLGERPGPDMKKVADQLRKYGRALSLFRLLPGVGQYAELAKESVSTIAELLGQDETESVESRRASLVEQLRSMEQRLVIMLDDIDRLSPDEIRDLLRVVRLVAHFPNTIYLLAFDRARVEAVLDSDPAYGQGYLDKVVQLSFDVPLASKEALRDDCLRRLSQVIDSKDHGPLDMQMWGNVFEFVVSPLLRNIRDVKRYVAATPVAIEALGPEVALADLLALEALRVFLPETFSLMSMSVAALTDPAGRYSLSTSSMSELHSQQVQRIVESADRQKDVVREALRLLFPASQQYLENMSYGPEWLKIWRRERRVAHQEVFRTYLQMALPRGALEAAFVSEVFDALGDAARLEAIIERLPPAELETLVERLEDYEGAFPAETVRVATPVLLNAGQALRIERAGFGDFGADLKMGRLILRLLRQLTTPAEVEGVVEAAVPTLRSLGAVLELVTLVGFREGAGHRLVSEDFAKKLEQDFVRQVDSASMESLIAERRLFEVIGRAHQYSDGEGPTSRTDVLRSRDGFVRVLESALSDVFTATAGDATASHSFRLPWGWMEEIFGSAELVEAVERLDGEVDVTDLTDRERAALELASKYAGGWRPREWAFEEEQPDEADSSRS